MKYSKAIAGNPYIVGSFACIGGGLFGLDISSMSGVLNNPYYLAYFHNPGSGEQGAITASMPAGSLVGAIVTSYLSDKLGRKLTIILSGWIWVLGCILQCASQNRGMLVVGRIIAGSSIGIASTTVPMYQAEITAPGIRGRMTSLQQWSITWGILIQFFIQWGCSYINSNASFRIPWGLQMIPGAVLAIGMLFFPESPRWLMDHDRNEEALEILSDLHGKGDPNVALVQLEYNEIRASVEYDRTEGSKSWMDIFAPGIFRRVGLGMSLQAWSQLSGMNVMMYYIVYVFESSGVTGRHATLVASSIQYALNVAMTVPAIIYIDKWGRRPMMILGFGGMSFWLWLVGGLQGGFGHWGSVDGSTTWVVVNHTSVSHAIEACSYLFVCTFAVTIGPTSWTYPAEIFPTRVRGKAVALSTASNWAFNTALAWAVPPALAHISYKTYFLFAAFNFVACIHMIFMFPETKGRTIEEMEAVFNAGHVFSAWAIKEDVGKHGEALPKGVTAPADTKEDYSHEEKA
ncbi:glucose transporter [Clavulina sp. PMI_390]|nr:glucose transporter [Clavulina sp. PMI_390]